MPKVHGQCMAVKTITIDLEAYEILSRCKRPGESFSQTIKHRLGKRVTGADLRAALRRSRLSEDTLEAIDAQVRARRSSAARSPRL
jgi:predicted CopG family antitoxin